MRSLLNHESFLKVLPFFLLATTGVGCASANFRPRIEFIGPYRDVQKLEEKADTMKWSEAADVRVAIGTFPKGMTYQNGKLKVTKTCAYEFIAKVYTNKVAPGSSVVGLSWYDYPEDQRWRKSLCAWQIPLSWLTFGGWGMVSPFYIPCRVYESNDVSDVNARKRRIIKTLKKATKVVGGDLLVITRIGKETTIDARSGQKLGTLDMAGAMGFALRRRSEEVHQNPKPDRPKTSDHPAKPISTTH